MITDAWFWVGTAICAVSLVVCVVMTVLRRFPDDVSILSIAAVELFLLVYGAGALVRGGTEPMQGELWEFWGYVITALIVPVVAFLWAVTDRTRWSNLVMAAVGPTIFVMLHRMQVIWFG
ncbi:hypothetical protein [Citricoccus nitrophenolicus]|uniref:hypothetical protein n=1 Tax=Citricoccus nitrophenolicus TaxID=863575 RepID=UPI0031EC4306